MEYKRYPQKLEFRHLPYKVTQYVHFFKNVKLNNGYCDLPENQHREYAEGEQQNVVEGFVNKTLILVAPI